jgi:hypothetical protein
MWFIVKESWLAELFFDTKKAGTSWLIIGYLCISMHALGGYFE